MKLELFRIGKERKHIIDFNAKLTMNGVGLNIINNINKLIIVYHYGSAPLRKLAYLCKTRHLQQHCGILASVIAVFEDSRRLLAGAVHMYMYIDVEFEVSHHERSHVVSSARLHVTVVVLVTRRSILPSFRYRRSSDINLSAGGLACRTTPRREETN